MSNPYGRRSGRLIDFYISEKIVLVGVTLLGSTEDDTGGLDGQCRRHRRSRRCGTDDAATNSSRPTWFIGQGKAQELKMLCLAVDADTVVFDNELTPLNNSNLRNCSAERRSITAVILDIFGQNARTPEGKAQVELALMRYRLPRLRRGGPNSHSNGGVGARFGGGEPN